MAVAEGETGDGRGSVGRLTIVEHHERHCLLMDPCQTEDMRLALFSMPFSKPGSTAVLRPERPRSPVQFVTERRVASVDLGEGAEFRLER